MTAQPSRAAAPPVIVRLALNGGIVVALVVIAVVATALAEPRFLNRLNVINVLRNFSFLAIPAVGQMLVMIAGGFDLSVGAVAALGSALVAAAMGTLIALMPDATWLAVPLAILFVMAVGALIGAFSGAVIAQFGVSPLILTLAMLSAVTGATLYYTQGIPIYGVPDSFVDAVGRGQILGLPVIFLIALALIAVVAFVQRFTVFGRHVHAVGSHPFAARLSGIGLRRTLVAVYATSGMLAALTGILMTARIGSGQSTIGATLGLETIAAAVIGGVSLRGGVGRVEQVALAALFLTVTANAMNLGQIDSKYQTLVLGVVLILALSLERFVIRGRGNG